MVDDNGKKYTVTGTDIDDVKRKNADSGMSYNEVKEFIAKSVCSKRRIKRTEKF